MSTTALAKTEPQVDLSNVESALIEGDLAKLSSGDRLNYYHAICNSVGLNPLTKPFEYIKLNGKLTLYALKGATDQLRKIHSVSIEKPDIQEIDDLIVVTVAGYDSTGRKDSDIGVVKKTDMGGNTANAIMKAVTKAKRRLTLSICGLGMLDETEVETIPNAQPFTEPKPQIQNFDPINKQIREVCQELNENGDSIQWKQFTLAGYATSYFGFNEDISNAFTELTEQNKAALLADLQDRLFERLAIASQDDETGENK